jgi:hypothetical protein
MHHTVLAAAAIFAFVAASRAVAQQAAAKPAPGRNSTSAAVKLSNYRLNATVLDQNIPAGRGELRSSAGATAGLAGTFTGSGPLHGLRLRLHEMRLFNKNDMLLNGPGIGVGVTQYAWRKHIFLTVSKQF